MSSYRQKKFICGNYMDVEIFPRPADQKPFTRARRVKESIPAQKRLNSKNACKFLTRLVHTNFTDEDLCIDLTFDDEHIPANRAEAIRKVKNYIKRLKTRRAKLGFDELRYVYVVSSWGEDGRETRIHVHMIMSGMDRDLAEKVWGQGRANTQRLQYDEYGVEEKVKYIAGQVLGHNVRTWACSQNLKRPEAIISDKAVSDRETERIARDPEDRAYFERKFPGWTFTDCSVEENFITGRCIYLRMRRYESRGGKNAKHKDA